MIRNFYNNNDVTYVIEAHSRIYSSEYQFDDSFKEFIRQSLTDFVNGIDKDKENLWILDPGNKPKGSIGIVNLDGQTAQLRWFLVEPELRGRGFGKELIHKAIEFCKECKFKRVILWTNSSLISARKLYKYNGFNIVETRKQIRSNQELIEERWELVL
jgi:ribosomal protein S18 acetylase RimI-like enzyme